MGVLQAIRSYAAHPDPLVAAANVVSLVVAGNQPFYPLYLYWAVGPVVWPAYFTFLSTPFFLAVPALGRRHALAGRALLPVTGILNTVMCVKLFGEASGVELFLAPCIMIAAMLFRQRERMVMLVLVGFGLAAFVLLHGSYGAPAYGYSAEEYARFLRLNAYSVAGLAGFVGLTFAGVVAKLEDRQS